MGLLSHSQLVIFLSLTTSASSSLSRHLQNLNRYHKSDQVRARQVPKTPISRTYIQHTNKPRVNINLTETNLNILSTMHCPQQFADQKILNTYLIPTEESVSDIPICKCLSYRVNYLTYKTFFGIETHKILSKEQTLMGSTTQTMLNAVCKTSKLMTTGLSSEDFSWMKHSVVSKISIQCQKSYVSWTKLILNNFYMRNRMLSLISHAYVNVEETSNALERLNPYNYTDRKKTPTTFYLDKNSHMTGLSQGYTGFDYVFSRCHIQNHALFIGGRDLYLTEHFISINNVFQTLTNCTINRNLIINKLTKELDFNEIEEEIRVFNECEMISSMQCPPDIIGQYSQTQRLISKNGGIIGRYEIPDNSLSVTLTVPNDDNQWCFPMALYDKINNPKIYVRTGTKYVNLTLAGSMFIHNKPMLTQHQDATKIVETQNFFERDIEILGEMTSTAVKTVRNFFKDFRVKIVTMCVVFVCAIFLIYMICWNCRRDQVIKSDSWKEGKRTDVQRNTAVF